MKESVEIYGGFAGTEVTMNQRDLSCNSCSILSGEIGAAGIADNSYTVVYNVDITATDILDGFVIRDGNDDRSPTSAGDGLGGGVYNHGYNSGFCHPTIRNCFFTSNSASWGGGAFNNAYNNGTTNPTYANCIFYQNHAYIEAGGMDTYAVGGSGSPTLYNCIFYQNTSATNVGAMYAWGGEGGLCQPTLINCAFIENSALNGHGGAFIADNIDENFTTSSGICTVPLQNCIVWGNTATNGQPQFHQQGDAFASVNVINSCADSIGQSGAHSLSGVAVFYEIPEVLSLVDLDGADDCWLTHDDGLIPYIGGNLYNTGNSPGVASTDIIGITRILYGGVDIGPYELDLIEGISEKNPVKVFLFPNPAAEILHVTSEIEILSISIYSLDGQLMYSEQIGQNFHQVDISELQPGTYILETNSSKMNRFKFIKN